MAHAPKHATEILAAWCDDRAAFANQASMRQDNDIDAASWWRERDNFSAIAKSLRAHDRLVAALRKTLVLANGFNAIAIDIGKRDPNTDAEIAAARSLLAELEAPNA